MIEVDNVKYEIVENVNNCFDEEIFKSLYTDYFKPYDYIFGDFSYDKVRLKGYYDDKNKKANKINKLSTLDDYKENYCSKGANTYLLKKVK